MNPITNMYRLGRAGLIIVWNGARVIPPDADIPAPLKFFARKEKKPGEESNQDRLTRALTALGPSYIKLGQFLATRDDIVGPELARDLTPLQDKLPPFPMEEAKKTIQQELGHPVEELYVEFGAPVAAASIAQVHKAEIELPGGGTAPVAVKVLRPGIERRFARDLESFRFAAETIEAWHRPSRRLRPVAVVDTLAQSVTIEMDLRMEAAAISEVAENSKEDIGFRVPEVDWTRSGRRVMTLEWIDGMPLADKAALQAAGFDPKEIGARLMQTFLRHAMRDGFFHADMHPGNLFVDKEGRIVAVDFGIMGRLGMKERRFLAEILYGFITRDYRRVSEVHFEAGYVPRRHSVELFAQALRAIGEPIMDRPANEISMAALLGQLLQYTEVFDMETRPELLMLQKTMVVVEGVSRQLDPELNIWTVSEPVVRDWIESQLGAEGRIEQAAEGAASLGRFAGHIPKLLGQAEQAADAFSAMAEEGLRLDSYTVERMAEAQSRKGRMGRLALWIGAISLAVIAGALVF
ncbi:2-polyprenylphenol 6-hydroxylase [Methyloligella sp. 2.7D]|uniref:2-polyprenylphenol 6-hydroxylase n=1 Tax=unclassified Methyloligella TaxID=2625955 RepID=UPI00157D991B|nr:2-polyprenylphenol 6-hydroxylase [Methyloligella sp. GL2]QKP78629.1 2-polyprenylphenol 6-hydroxylase [Methyloligella sp. GL2]